MRWAACVGGVLTLLAGCEERGAARPSAAAPTTRPDEAPALAPAGTYAHPALDAVLAPRLDDQPALYATDVEALLRSDAAAPLAGALAEAADAELGAVPADARRALQNDVWGAWQRLTALGIETERADALRQGAARLTRHLAVPAPRDGAPGIPAAARAALGPGWDERASALPVLAHERAFGLRRLFHVALRGEPSVTLRPPERALVSQLIALDPRGRPYPTDVVGEVEVLAFEGDALTRARVFELDRAALRERGAADALAEVSEVRHVPGAGANGFLIRLESPEPLAALPCARCHDDDEMMSLPESARTPAERAAPLLEQVAERARALWTDAQ